MKKITIMLICWASTLAVFAQSPPEPLTSDSTHEMHTLFHKGHGGCKVPMGMFMELNGGYTMFGSKSVFLPGMSMGMILNHHWTIGITGSFIGDHNGVHFSNIYYDSATSSMHGAHLNGGYGGLLLEYTLFPEKRFHFAFPLMIGLGEMYYSNTMHHHDSTMNFNSHHEFHHSYISKDRFFVVEPGVRVECNVVKSLRIGLGISYRYSPDFKLKSTSADLINQFTAKLTLRFGKF
jgi:hypothetical protein